MEAALQQLIVQCTVSEVGNPLSIRVLEDFCTTHGLSMEEFAVAFARAVAEQFAAGSLAYWPADAAMNRLVGAFDHGVEGFAWEVFLAFDEGEFAHSEDPAESVPWQKYTLPSIMELLGRERN